MQKGILIEDSLVEMINGKRLKEMEPYPEEIVQTLFLSQKKRIISRQIFATDSPNRIFRFGKEQGQKMSR
jgi:hypothetical protein